MLIDVREPYEFATGRLEVSVNIPVSQVSARLREIPSDRVAVFICRSGARSLEACGAAARGGVDSVAHIEGGLLAWSATVDPSLEVA